MTRHLIPIFILLCPGCTPDRSEPPPAPEAPAATAPATGHKAVPQKATEPPKEVVVPKTTIYGIQIPTGMHPAMGPENVYRFEGNQPLSQVVMLIEEQIEKKQKLREIGGWLFRFARAKRATSEFDMKPLAIRIFEQERPSGGSVLDIWLEKEYAEALPDRSAKTSGYTFKALKKPVVRGGMTDEAREARATKLKDTMRIMKKVEMGEPLTDEEKKSDVFY